MADKKIESLAYQDVEVHFVYAFLWKSTNPINTSVFETGLDSKTACGWLSPLIHNRIIGALGRDKTERLWLSSYQPTFVLERRCLEISGTLESGSTKEEDDSVRAWLIVPLRLGVRFPRKGTKSLKAYEGHSDIKIIPVRISWTIRMFDFGCGTFTARIALDEIEKLPRAERLARIHWLLRLSPNMDVSAEIHCVKGEDRDAGGNLPVVDSFLFSPTFGTFRLYDFFMLKCDEALQSLPGESFRVKGSRKAPKFYRDVSSLAYNECRSAKDMIGRVKPFPEYTPREWCENQAPFTFCTIVLDKAEFERIGESSVEVAREIGSICCKLTLDNRKISDLEHLSEGYLTSALGFDKDRSILLNRSHDDRLFFTFSRRGALAATAWPEELPAFFVVPSLLNLFELLRARLFGGITVCSRLARVAEVLSRLDPLTGKSPDVFEYARLRMLVVQNLQNPLEYLFDGGSVSALALEAEEALFAAQAWRNARHSFELVDRLMADWDAEEFRVRFGG